MMELSTTSGPITLLVTDIIYEHLNIYISDPHYCFTKLFLERKLNSSSFLPYYQFDIETYRTVAFFNCSSVKKRHLRNEDRTNKIHPQDMTTCPIYAANSDDSVLNLDLASCTKMCEVNITINAGLLSTNNLILSWPKTKCAVCTEKGMKCRWNNSSTKGDIECYDCRGKRKTIHIPKSLIFSAIGII
jgi:hypothetical protein